MRGLNEVYRQASQDDYSRSLTSTGQKSYISYGFKIVKETKANLIKIFYVTKGGDFYRELDQDEYKYFIKWGWKKALYVLYLSNCRTKLSNLEIKINKALVENESVKVIRQLKSHRRTLLKNYQKINIKLNQKL